MGFIPKDLEQELNEHEVERVGRLDPHTVIEGVCEDCPVIALDFSHTHGKSRRPFTVQANAGIIVAPSENRTNSIHAVTVTLIEVWSPAKIADFSFA